MREVLITSFDMEVGGVERSLISMLNNFDYTQNKVDVMLYRHTGDLLHLLPEQISLLNEVKAYKTFRMPVGQVIKTGNLSLAMARLLAKYKVSKDKTSEPGYKQMQYMWEYALPFLPPVRKKYDVAISYLWPHYVVAEKVDARIKIAWIHTDFSTAETDIATDLEMWRKYDVIAAVSEHSKQAFLTKYPSLSEKIIVIENIASPDFVRMLADEEVENPMIHDPRFNVITVARLSHAKGIDQAIKALNTLKGRGYRNIAWYVVGYGGDEQMLRALIKENNLEDDFILLGKKTNPYPFIKEADLYVQPSRYEGKAVTVGEAQILGKPVLITNYPTAPSQVNAGVDGEICALSVEGIADGIQRLYENNGLRERLAVNCSRRDYNNSRELEKLYDVMQEGAMSIAKR